MSKKVSEFDRYERMQKLQKNSEAIKKKSAGTLLEKKKKNSTKKTSLTNAKNLRYDDIENDYYEI